MTSTTQTEISGPGGPRMGVPAPSPNVRGSTAIGPGTAQILLVNHVFPSHHSAGEGGTAWQGPGPGPGP